MPAGTALQEATRRAASGGRARIFIRRAHRRGGTRGDDDAFKKVSGALGRRRHRPANGPWLSPPPKSLHKSDATAAQEGTPAGTAPQEATRRAANVQREGRATPKTSGRCRPAAGPRERPAQLPGSPPRSDQADGGGPRPPKPRDRREPARKGAATGVSAGDDSAAARLRTTDPPRHNTSRQGGRGDDGSGPGDPGSG